jgi:hypothetical protein
MAERISPAAPATADGHEFELSDCRARGRKEFDFWGLLRGADGGFSGFGSEHGHHFFLFFFFFPIFYV